MFTKISSYSENSLESNFSIKRQLGIILCKYQLNAE
jgi:hypothetical protein